MAKPSTLPEWDTTQVNAIEPDTAHKEEGWLAPGGVPEKPPFQTFNYWQNLVYRWVNYFTGLNISFNFDSVSSMVANTNLEVGNIAKTSAYYSTLPGGDAEYEIVAAGTGTADGGSYIDLTGSSLQAKLIDTTIINGLQFGLKRDGSTDNTTVFQAIAAYANANAGINLYLPRGTYMINSGTITFSVNDVNIWGDGANGTIISTTHASNDLIVFGDGINVFSHCFVRDIRIATNVTRTGGVALTFDKSTLSGGSRFQILEHFVGIDLIDTVLLRLYDGIVSAPSPTSGIGIHVHGGNDQSLTDVFVVGDEVSQPLAGLHVTKTGGLWIDNVGVLWCGNGCLIQPQSGDIVENVFSTRCAWDSGDQIGFHIDCQTGATVRRITSTSDWAASNTSHGILIGGAGTKQAIEFIGSIVIGNGLHGLFIADGTEIKVLGGVYTGNSQNSPGSNHGIVCAGSNFSIIGAKSGPTAGAPNSQGYGISVTTGDFYIISNNDVLNNITGGILLGTAPSSTKIVRDNLGFVTENVGGSAVLNGTASIVVNHGLSTTPNHVLITFNGSSEGLPYVSTITATQFTINLGATATADRAFFWEAKIR